MEGEKPLNARYKINKTFLIYCTAGLNHSLSSSRFWGLTTVQLLEAEMHFLSSHHWQPRVLEVQLAQSEKRKHSSSELSEDRAAKRHQHKSGRDFCGIYIKTW